MEDFNTRIILNTGEVIMGNNHHLHCKDVELVKEALSKISYDDKIIGLVYVLEVDMGRVIGGSDCVPTDDSDIISYHKRGNRKVESRMVHGREPIPVSTMTIVLRKLSYDEFEFKTIFIGKRAPREPWDPSIKSKAELMESIAFWSRHALRIECKND